MQYCESSIQLVTIDNTKLRATYFSKKDNRAIILVASATGVPQLFYRRFALAALERSFNVLTLDYRGIGQSAPQSLKGYHVDYLDWARQDLAAGLAWCQQHDLPIFLVGHSYGGHALGLLPNHSAICAAIVYGVGAGWSGWMPAAERMKVNLLWNVFAPVLVKSKGYLAWNKLGMGEDLPKGVYEQWKQWCKYPHYFFDDPNYAWLHDQFAEVKSPLFAINAVDDKWAQPASRDAFFKGYRNADLRTLDMRPTDFGMRKIDHMGYFRQAAGKVWQHGFNWLNQHF